MEIELCLRWSVGEKPAEELPSDLVRLLDGIARGGNLRFAAQDARLSYRHAWGMVKHWEERFGTKLVSLEQGRGSELTRAGELLWETWHPVRERTDVALAEAAAQASRAFEGLSSVAQGDRLALAASHGFGVSALVTRLRDARAEPDVHYMGSEQALKRYAAGECQVAGFHLPLGKHGRSLWLRFQRYLDPRRDVALLVETRELGFMVRPGSPRVDIRALLERGLRFQNRQTGSGSRLVFDLLLAEAGLRPESIAGYDDEEYTHVAVAAIIASGGADVGFGARGSREIPARVLAGSHREILRRDAARGTAAQAVRAGAAPARGQGLQAPAERNPRQRQPGVGQAARATACRGADPRAATGAADTSAPQRSARGRIGSPPWLACAGAVADTLRIHVVPIVEPDRYLDTLLREFAAREGVTLAISARHGREGVAAVRAAATRREGAGTFPGSGLPGSRTCRCGDRMRHSIAAPRSGASRLAHVRSPTRRDARGADCWRQGAPARRC